MQEAPDIVGIGNAGWTLLHTMAAYYPEAPDEARQRDTRNFLHMMGRVFPCSHCGQDFLGIIERHPPRVESQRELSLWMCEAHNFVNESLGKPAFPCSRVDERWRRSAIYRDTTDQPATP
jgi:mitochondrial FAD-linked sulfhydryl oxidase